MQQTPAKVFAEILRAAREQQGLTPEQLADELELHRHVIRDWERGVRTPRLASAIRWAKSLGFELELR